MLDKQSDQSLAAFPIYFVKASENWAVKVDDA